MSDKSAILSAENTLSCELVTLASGATALRDRITGEVMHPGVGPQAEAETLYLSPSRIAHRLDEAGAPLVLWDVGLGGGALAAGAAAIALHGNARRRLDIVSFECDLSAFRLVLASPHADAMGLGHARSEVRRAAETVAGCGYYESDALHWRVVAGPVPATLRAERDARPHIVFWDLFSPNVHPALWSRASFTALRERVDDSCTVHTYSAATAVRTAMLLAGFFVGAGVAVGAKRETTEAAATIGALRAPLGQAFLERVRRSTAAFSGDVLAKCGAEGALTMLRAHPQFAHVLA
jgi:queuine tRNA-ribosyltransferase